MKYKKNYIENFIFRIDFKNRKTEEIKTLVENLKEVFKDNLNILQTRNIMNNTIEINDENQRPQIASSEKDIEYRLINNEENEFIVISKGYICYETKNYEFFEPVKEKINLIIDSLIEILKIDTFTRVGMRFINDIILPSEKQEEVYDWNGYINNNILTSLKFFKEKINKNVLQSMHVIDIDSSVNSNIYYTIQHGLYNSRKPGPVLDKQYIIDIDGHTKSVEESEEIKEKIDKIHSEIEEIFENIIDEKLRKNMGEKEVE